MNEKELVATKALAARLKVSANSIRNWVKSGRIPPSAYIRVNQTRRFYVADVEDALRADRPDKTDQPRKQPYVLDSNEE